MAYNLSEKAIAEKYEDLLFTKVMALYAEEESEKILSEIKNEEPADPKAVQKLFDKKERSENLRTLWKYSKKILQFAAMVVFVAVVSLSSVVVASAEAREAVAEAIYHLMIKDYGRYTEVSIGDSTDFIDPEIYDWEGAYAPTYMPKEYILKEKSEMPNRKTVTYNNGEKYVAISQSVDGVFQIDTEDADIYKKISINESDAVYVENKGFVFIVWSIGEKNFFVRGTINPEEALKIAESLKPIEKYEAPAEEYEFVDPEIYDWEGAYGLTFVPDKYKFKEKKSAGTKNVIIYESNNGHFTFSQSNGNPIARVDTEDAENVETIIINESEALLVEKDGFVIITWNNQNTFFSLRGTLPADTLIFIAQGIKPIGKTETEEPAEEYEFVDPEIYTWENAYGMTYVPENFIFINSDDLGSSQFLNYRNGEKVLSFIQSTDTSSFVDSENADSIKNIIIGTSEALLITKSDWSCISWTLGNKLLQLSGNVSTEEIIKVAEGIRPIN